MEFSFFWGGGGEKGKVEVLVFFFFFCLVSDRVKCEREGTRNCAVEAAKLGAKWALEERITLDHEQLSQTGSGLSKMKR